MSVRNGAALLEQEGEMVVRVVDLHPWVAEPAERLFDGGHYQQAILAAAQNLEVRWRGLLGVATGTLSDLANESFSEQPPRQGSPRLRYPAFGSDPKSDAWKNAHVGVMSMARAALGGYATWACITPKTGSLSPVTRPRR